MMEAVTQQTMLLQQVLEKVGQKSTRQQKGCFKCGGPHMQRDCSPGWQATVGHHQNNGGGKWGRSGTGVSSPVSGSQVSKSAYSKTWAVPESQEEWTTVKRKRRGKRQTGRQSEKLAGNDQAKEMSGSAQKQVDTEAQPAKPLEVIQKTPPPNSTFPR